jgi:hypothetical protein
LTGKQHEMPAHHLLELIDGYVTAARIGIDKTGRGTEAKQLGSLRMARQMIVRRTLAAGIVISMALAFITNFQGGGPH